MTADKDDTYLVCTQNDAWWSHQAPADARILWTKRLQFRTCRYRPSGRGLRTDPAARRQTAGDDAVIAMSHRQRVSRLDAVV